MRRTFGIKFEITDADVLAFLQKANRKIEKVARKEILSSFNTRTVEGENGVRYSIKRASIPQIEENIKKVVSTNAMEFHDWERFSNYSNKQKHDLARQISNTIKQQNNSQILINRRLMPLM